MTGGDQHQRSHRERSAGRSVLLVTPRWARDGGVAAHLTASAALLARQGLEVHVLAARIDSQERPPGVSVYCSPSLCEAGAPIAERLGARLPRTDLVHIHQLDDPELVGALQARAPVVISVHGYTACTSGVHYFRAGHECDRQHGPSCIVRLARCAHTRQPGKLPARYRQAGRALESYRRADLVVSYSSAIDRHLAKNGLTRRRVVPLFATLPAGAGSGHAERKRVLFAGRVTAPKGVDVLIRAAPAIDGEIVVCGDGWRLTAMRRLARRRGVAHKVRFTGWLQAERLAQELADASVVVVPSLWPEPFGLVGIEAMAAGRPVIASDTGGVRDWLEQGVNGLLVRPGDAAGLAAALNELLADPTRQAAMGAAGRELAASRFSPEGHLEALLECYRAAGSGSPMPPSRLPVEADCT